MSRYIVVRHFPSAVLAFLMWSLLPLGVLAQDPCADGRPIPIGTLRDAQWTAEPLCYTLELPTAGMFVVEAAVAGETSRAEPVIDVLACGGELRVHDRWAARWWGESVEAGPVAVCVAAEDPARHLGELKLSSAFAGQLLVKSGDDDEDEAEPDPTLPPPPPSLFDPIGSPSTSQIAMCRALREDDHADLFHCATRLVPGEAVDAEIRNAWGDDSDLFALRLDGHASVRLALTGEAGITASLHDRHGDRLWTTPGQPGFVEALVPGLYYVRVSASAGFEGDYRLEAAVSPR